MSTSGTINSTLTAREIIVQAAELIGLASVGDALDPNVGASALKHLNWMLKTWTARTDNLNRIDTVYIEWPANTAQVSLSPNYLHYRNVIRRIGGTDLPLMEMSMSDYALLPNKASTGTPLNYNLIRTNTGWKMRVWPVPTAITDVYADAVRVIEDITALTQNVDLPQEWLETVYYGVAKRLMAVYPAASVGQANDVRETADQLYAILMAHDQESGSVFLQPGFGGSSWG